MRTVSRSAAAASFFLAGEAIAGTPDGLTPSVETVCDALDGSAYGLCTAYCEAMDCDSPDPHASPRACDAVGARYLRATGEEPPCLASPCDVAAEDDFFGAVGGGSFTLDVLANDVAEDTDAVSLSNFRAVGWDGTEYTPADDTFTWDDEARVVVTATLQGTTTYTFDYTLSCGGDSDAATATIYAS